MSATTRAEFDRLVSQEARATVSRLQKQLDHQQGSIDRLLDQILEARDACSCGAWDTGGKHAKVQADTST